MHRIHATIAASAFALVAMAGATAVPAQAQTEIQWWHAMPGANNEMVENLAKEFNATQSEYKVVPVYKGTYPETLNAGIAAFRARQPPHIIQVFDVGTGVMMGAKSAIKPIAEVMKEGGQSFNKADYLSGIVSYYSDADGTMLSFPFNSSSPDPVLQQGKLPESRARPRGAAEDLAGSVRGRQEDQGVRPVLRHDQHVADLDSSGKLQRLEQPALCDRIRTASPA